MCLSPQVVIALSEFLSKAIFFVDFVEDREISDDSIHCQLLNIIQKLNFNCDIDPIINFSKAYHLFGKNQIKKKLLLSVCRVQLSQTQKQYLRLRNQRRKQKVQELYVRSFLNELICKSIVSSIFITSMANTYAFAFPKYHPASFKLLTGSTVGYLADSIFYKLDLNNGKAQALHHPEGRTYQAYTSLPKRGVTVLADYGRSSNIYFFFPESHRNFQIKNVCPLQIVEIELSLDGKYLAVACGSPWFRVIFINVDEKRVIGGTQSFIDLKGRQSSLIKMDFNPTNRKIISLSFKDHVQIYEIKDCLEMKQTGIQNSIIVVPKLSANVKQLEASVWDQLGNLYLSAEHKLWVWSTETGKELAGYDIQIEGDDHLVRSLVLTQKHILVFYSTGRVQWLMKFYPQLLDQDSTIKPFQLDRYHQGSKKVVHALYDHHFSKILIAYNDGFLGTLNVPAEKSQSEQQQDDENKRKKKEAKKFEVQSTFIGPYHRSKIILIHQIEGTSRVITISMNGRVIMWSGKAKKQLGYFDTDGPLTSADINNKHNVLAVTRQDGSLQFYNISSFENPFIFKEFKLTKEKIDQIAFSSSGQEIAALSKSQGRVYYILTALTLPFQILGYVTLAHPSVHIAWHATKKTAVSIKHELLLVCIGYGVLMINGPAASPTNKRGEQLNLQLDVYALRTDLQQNLVCSLPSGQILTTGQDKLIKKYRQPEQLVGKVDFKSKFPIPPPLEEFQAHQLKITTWSSNQKHLASASPDGSVQIREIGNFGQYTNHLIAGWKQESITCVAPLSGGGVYAGSYGGCFQICKSSGESLTDQYKVEAFDAKRLSKDRQTKYFEQMIEQQYLQKMKDAIVGKKKIQLEKLNKIKLELQTLLAQNQKHDELEKLSRDEFAIDLQSRQKVAQIGREKCLKIRQESRIKILKNQVITKKLKQITWDRMDIHLKGINGLKNNFVVFNYQLRKISKEEKRILQIIFDLRRAQKKQQKKREPELNYEFYSNKNVVNGGVIQPLILNGATATEKKQDKKQQKGKKRKEEEQNNAQAQQVEEIFNEQEWSLLYNSFELYSDNAKRNQIIMMKYMIVRIKETFNKQFEKIMKLRQNQNELINDKNKRIQEICEQLKRNNEIIRGRKNILQSNQSILEVAAQQISFKRYLSKEQRQKAEKQRLKEQERLRKLAEDDSSQRALQEMMAGTLQEKKTSVLEVTVERQKWMDKPLQQMSQEQKSKMKEYEQKKQKAEEEKERIVKKLEAQLRKLKQQIDDVMQKYDQKLFGLAKRRLEYEYRIEQQELYCTRLYLSISNVRQQQKKQKELFNQIQKQKQKTQILQNEKQALINQQSQIERTKEAKHAGLDARKLGEIQSKIKTIEKSIFDEYQTNHKKRRQMEQKLVQSQPQYRNLLIPLDPMKEIQSKNLSVQKAKDFNFFINQIKVLQQTYDIPEGSLLQILENRFNIRKQQNELQNKVKILKDTLNVLQQKKSQDLQKLKQQQDQYQAINSYLQRTQSDLEVQIRIKQGQVQLNNQKPVPQLEDALLISKAEIDDKNSKIIINANQKIKIMQQIKTCKISVTEQTLNLQKKDELINKLNSMIKEIQMLKVKKEMQIALAKKDTKMNQNQIKSLKQQMEKVRKEGQKRISHFEKKIEKIKSEIETIKKENKQLQTQKWNLESTVKQREKIKEMMVGENGEGDQQAKEKFQQIAINRKLFDKAKQQTEEIQLLRQQLSKLKAKTFANFSNAQR